MKQDGQGAIVGHEDPELRAPGDMKIPMAEYLREVLGFESPFGGIFQDDSVLVPQERTKEGLGIQEQAKRREHEEQEEEKA
jgi:hypothetical protein